MKKLIPAILVSLLQTGTGYAFENFEQAFNQMRHRYSLGHYKRMIAIAPDAVKLSEGPTQKFDVLYYKGLALHGLQKFWQAEQAFAEASRLAGISEKCKQQAVFNQIKSQYDNRHFISALANAEKHIAFKDKPTVIQLHILMTAIESAKELNHNGKALELAEKMIESAGPESGWYYRGKIIQVQILCLLKEYAQAEKLVKQIDIRDVPPQMRAEFLAWTGYCYEKDDKHELAAKQYSKAYELDSNYYSALAALRYANMLEHDGKNYEKVVSGYEKVLRLSGAHPKHKSQAIYRIADIYRHYDKPDIALYFLAQIDKVDNSDIYWKAKIYNMHGDIMYAAGDTDLARSYFKACVNLSPKQSDSTIYAKEILAQMEKKRVLPEKQ